MVVDGKQIVYRINEETFHCGVTVFYRYIGGKWKSVIIYYLRKGLLRFSEIKALIPDMTEKMLSLQLKALKEDGIIKKTVIGEKAPFRVEYELTILGESLVPIIESINQWGTNFANENGELQVA